MAGLQEFAAPGIPESYISNLDPTFARSLQTMLAAAPGGGISIYSGARSNERQAQLWEQALRKYGSPEAARKWVAPPGHSNHNRGMAADLRYADPGLVDWAHKNAGDYGLTFPLANENWHIEPLGLRGPGGAPAPASMPAVPPQAMALNDGLTPDMPSRGAFPTGAGASFMPGDDPGAGPRFTENNMTGDAFFHDVLSGINPLRTLVMGKLMKVLA